MAARYLTWLKSTAPMALPEELVGVTAPVWLPVAEACAEEIEAAADEAASGLLAVLRRTASMRWTTPLDVRTFAWTTLALDDPEVTKTPVD